MSKILITGAAGGMAQVVSEQLKDKYELVGVDPRAPKEGRKFPGEFFQIDYRQRKMAELFRTHKFTGLVHLGRIPVAANVRKTTRFNTNVLGTRSLLDLALKYSVKNVVVMSTFHIYGAHQHNHLYITEEDPLLASHTFPEIADSVELDNVSVAFSLRNPKIHTVILRPANIIGNKIYNQISNILRAKFCPLLMGYDPMQQFIHETDIASAVALALEGKKSGIYNVAGEGVLPFSHAIELAGSTAVHVPPFLSLPGIEVMKMMGYNFPKHLVDYFKFPTVISDKAFRKDFGYTPKISTVDAIRSLNQANAAASDQSPTSEKAARTDAQVDES